MKKTLAMLLAALMLFSLAACGSDGPANSDSGSTTSGAPSQDGGKYLNVMLGTNVMSLDTNYATDGDSFEVIAGCIDGLMQMDGDGAAVPAIAESYDLSDDGKTYTFHLRDAKWANGTPVTANDFVFAWRLGCQINAEYNYMFGSGVEIGRAHV